MNTRERTLRPGPAGPGGYRQLVGGPGEPPVRRTELLAPSVAGGAAGADLGECLLRLAHLSDLHVCDAQSPARVEFLDRWADPDSPLLDELGEVGTYRPQELLTVAVLESMVRAVNVEHARLPLDLTIVTGDNTDNAQANELAWYLTLLEGGDVRPDSGDRTRFEGVADGEVFDDRFWHPETSRADLPRTEHGFPRVPGLLDAVRRPLKATGLTSGWLAVHGNHDRLLQGTVPGIAALAEAAVGAVKPIGLPAHWSADAVAELIVGLADCDPDALAALGRMRMRLVTADLNRRIVGRTEFVDGHFGPRARPNGHGFGSRNADGSAYYAYDHGPVRLLVLDTVNPHGGWQGSLDLAQFEWLADQLAEADRQRRYVLLASHHPLETLTNGTGDGRVLGAQLTELLARHRCVVAWLAGHTHAAAAVPRDGYWQLVAPSLIDWPQQGRIVELRRGTDGVLTLTAVMLDHAGQAPWQGGTEGPSELAGLSRELAANDWQAGRQAEQPRAGADGERNVELLVADPWPAEVRPRLG